MRIEPVRVVTEADLVLLRAAGACRLPTIGTRAEDVPADDLAWAALRCEWPPADRDLLYALCGARSWWRDGKQHREDGPAIEYANGERAWYRDGKDRKSVV